MKKNHSRLIICLSVVILAMFGFGFALVPIYNKLCKSLGINGKIYQEATTNNNKATRVDKNREITVEFVATKNSTLPWVFYPKITKLKVHPGEMTKLSFYAENQSDFKMTVQAIPSITPGIAAKYLKKTECFCFSQQTLNSHEAMDMPLLFHLDTDLPKNINTITLSYTLFDVSQRVAQKTL